MSLFDNTLFETDSPFGQNQVVETVYRGRPARVLFSGDRAAAQSGLAMDENPELLIEYNQRLMEIIEVKSPQRILLIGGGAYTLPRAIGRLPKPPQLTVVERDPILLELAQRYFDFTTWPGFTAIHGDGRNFLETSTEIYDLIVIDAFSDLSVPLSLITLEAMQTSRRHLTPQGLLAINVIAAARGQSAVIIDRLSAASSAVWPHLEILAVERGYDSWQPQNLLFITYRRGPAIAPLIHCATLSLPSPNLVEPWRDQA
jgi:protein-L-isoaspartate O-methyltransferase